MTAITKSQADRCTTHHAACGCREYRAQAMEAALKIILVWAGNRQAFGDDDLALKHIADKAKEILG